MFKKYFKKYVQKYSDLLEQKPMQTKMFTTSGLYIVGDVVAQKYMLEEENIDFRKVSCGTVAATASAYIMHLYYGRMHILMHSGKIISETAPKMKRVLTTLFLDQTFFSPFINSVFLLSVAAMFERSFSKAREIWSDRFVSTQKTSYMMWAPAQFINYYYVPLQYRILYMNVVGVFWTSIRSYITFCNNEEISENQQQQVEQEQAKNLVSQGSSEYLQNFTQVMHNVHHKVNNHFSNYNQYFSNNIYLMQGVY